MSINCDILQVTEALRMTPSSRSAFELRFGKKGSLSVNSNSNFWYDHEHQKGGGMLDLVVHKNRAKDRSEAANWLKQHGLIANDAARPIRKPLLSE